MQKSCILIIATLLGDIWLMLPIIFQKTRFINAQPTFIAVGMLTLFGFGLAVLSSLHLGRSNSLSDDEMRYCINHIQNNHCIYMFYPDEKLTKIIFPNGYKCSVQNVKSFKKQLNKQ